MQRRDLVIELLTALVEAAVPTSGDLAGQLRRQRRLPVHFDRQVGRDLKQVQGTTGVAVSGLCEQLEHAGRRHQVAPAEPALAVGEGRLQQQLEIARFQRLEHVDTRAGQQCGVDLEGRILGGGADEDEGAVLDEGQEGVLLRLVEAMHLVQEQHGRPTVGRPRGPGRLDHHANVLDAREYRRERLEARAAGVRDEARQGGLAGARRPPEDHRVRCAGLEQAAQGTAGAKQVRLADDLVEAGRPHAVGQGPPRLGRSGQQ